MNKDIFEALQTRSKADHLDNLLKIIRFDFWGDDERSFFIHLYVRVIIEKEEWDNLTRFQIKHIPKLIRILDE